MSRTTLILAAACACAACSQQSPHSSAPASASTAAKASAAAAPAPASTAPDIGIDLSYVDKSVKPGDNFFDYANGAWVKTTEIPADRSSIGAFYDVFEVTEKHTAELIRNAGASNPAAGTDARYDDDTASIYFAWTLGSDSTSGVAAQTVTWYSQASCGGTGTTIDPGASATSTSLSSGLVTNTSYSFKVTTTNGAGCCATARPDRHRRDSP